MSGELEAGILRQENVNDVSRINIPIKKIKVYYI